VVRQTAQRSHRLRWPALGGVGLNQGYNSFLDVIWAQRPQARPRPLQIAVRGVAQGNHPDPFVSMVDPQQIWRRVDQLYRVDQPGVDQAQGEAQDHSNGQDQGIDGADHLDPPK
jgi:hypothetical protein